jgi:hypothetical protein
MTKFEELEKLVGQAYGAINQSPKDCAEALIDALVILSKINKTQEKLYRTLGVKAYRLIPRETHGVLLDELLKGDKYQVSIKEGKLVVDGLAKDCWLP